MESQNQQNWLFTTGRTLLYLGALTPVCFSVVFHALGPMPRPVSAGKPRPALAFDQYLVDRGHVNEGQRSVDATFRFRNFGQNTVHIRELVPSCGCLKPAMKQREYRPGESGEFYVFIETPNETPGKHEYEVKVCYDDPQPRETTVTFKVDLPEPTVVIRPKALLIDQPVPGSISQDVVISDARARPLRVTGVKSTSPLLNATYDRSAIDSGIYHLTLTTAEVIPPGKHSETVTVTTDDKAFPELHVRLLIRGPQKPAVKRP